ncbi:hypothetical protein ACFYWP_07545 [Actinacidiphila glaucinigra]|uniref:hypothetical protein n=1 Tax=Actinacidiphila glaucinigra TaxID=235986 RepID=UPI0036818787
MAEPEEEERQVPEGGEPERAPLDEESAWAELVAAYGKDPEPGTGSWPAAEDVPAAERDGEGGSDGEREGEGNETLADPSAVPSAPDATRIILHPVLSGPRDYELDEDADEGHYEPPEPPPLPEADVTTKFAWLAAVGGPLLIFGFVLFQEPMPWWALTVGIGGFLGGFATLVTRMRPGGDEDDDLPGGGAVV